MRLSIFIAFHTYITNLSELENIYNFCEYFANAHSLPYGIYDIKTEAMSDILSVIPPADIF